MARNTEAIISTNALRANVERVRAYTSQQKIMAVIKANAYGHGSVNVATTIEPQVDAFAVCCLEEGLELRESGIKKPIILLEGFFQAEELPTILKNRLQVVIHSAFQLHVLQQAKLSRQLDVWLKVDSGMHRLGFNLKDVHQVWQMLQELPKIAKPIRLMTHLACADNLQDESTPLQIHRFTKVAKDWETERSVANSAGIIGWPQSHGDWVRPGIMLYGSSPFPGRTGEEEELSPVMQFQSTLINIRRCRKGDNIGYGATWTCPQAMLVGVIATGYADGYPRHAPTGTPVLVNGKRVPLIGRVSMDMITVDLRGQPNVREGDSVILWGKDLPVEEVAHHAGTISYELLSKVGSRVRRILR